MGVWIRRERKHGGKKELSGSAILIFFPFQSENERNSTTRTKNLKPHSRGNSQTELGSEVRGHKVSH